MAVHELRAKRATTFDAFAALAAKADFDAKKDQPEYDRLKAEVEGLDGAIKRAEEAQELSRKGTVAVGGQDRPGAVPAAAESSPYVSDAVAKQMGYGSPKSLVLGGAVKMLAAGGGGVLNARAMAHEVYGESHPVTKALVASVGASGGFFVPPDYIPDYIEILRAKARVRAAGPRTLPMPRGTLRLPAQTAAATASYGGEDRKISASQPGTGALVASFKKLAGLVPISNDLMRFADPAIDAFVRDDLVKVMALREDLAFLTGDGTQDTPRGYLSFANAYALASGGSAGAWSSSANSTAASGGNFITSSETYTETTVVAELGAAANALDTANVPDDKRAWFMHPRSRNYLYDLLNSLGRLRVPRRAQPGQAAELSGLHHDPDSGEPLRRDRDQHRLLVHFPRGDDRVDAVRRDDAGAGGQPRRLLLRCERRLAVGVPERRDADPSDRRARLPDAP